jgi:hypothetical protein
MSSSNKVIVFDMDETLGYFVELGMFWDVLRNFYIRHNMCYDEEEKMITMKDIKSADHFCKVLDLFPEFIRPNIFKIITYILSKKNRNSTSRTINCDKLLIYTNNQGPKSWANLISSYFNHRLQTNVFDTVIGAYKIKDKHIELERTTHDKTVDDLRRCAKLYEKTDICFIDDQFHPYMKHENVYYINVKPYVYHLKYETMAERYFNAFKSYICLDKDNFIHYITSCMRQYNFTLYNKPVSDYKIDKYIGKRMLFHVKQFFKSGVKNHKTVKKCMRYKYKRTLKWG